MSDYIIPVIICAVGLLLLFDKGGLLDDFLAGAMDGLMVVVRLIPTLTLLLVGVSMFSASGALDLICSAASPLTSKLGIPSDLLPLVIMRPVSGSGSIALISDLYATAGVDSYAGFAGSVLMGSSDTLFYICAVYFSAAGVKKSGMAIPFGLLIQFFCVFMACLLAKLFM